jgi:hypothetical protein
LPELRSNTQVDRCGRQFAGTECGLTYPDFMHGETVPSSGIRSLLAKLQGLRDLARESGPDDVYLGLIEVCAWCEALADENGDAVDMETLLARAEKRHLHVVHDSRTSRQK